VTISGIDKPRNNLFLIGWLGRPWTSTLCANCWIALNSGLTLTLNAHSIDVMFYIVCLVVMSRYEILSSVRDRYFWHEIPRDRDRYLPKSKRRKKKYILFFRSMFTEAQYYVKWCTVPDIWLRSWHGADKMLLPKKKKNIFLLFIIYIFYLFYFIFHSRLQFGMSLQVGTVSVSRTERSGYRLSVYRDITRNI